MTDPRYERLEELFHQALVLSASGRQRLIHQVRKEDPSLASELDDLLRLSDSPTPLHGETFFERNRPVGVSSERRHPNDGVAVPKEVGTYRIDGVLGSGGMGTVYRATQRLTGRTVAVKTLRAENTSPAFLRRFEHEVKALARLRHPGIGQIYEAGVTELDGRHTPYFAMEFVPQAESIDEYVRGHALTLEQKLRLFVKVCRAVEHGHRAGVIHRDLKPDNVLVDGSMGDPEPKVIDFGVARTPELGLDLTVTGEVLGTLQYMSPEQLGLEAGEVDARSDVYSLGLVLFEMIVGVRPYEIEPKPLQGSINAILESRPPSLSSIDESLRGDVETIVAKALEWEPDRRYASAADFADDIERHLTRRPIRARPPSLSYRLRVLSRRHRGLVLTVLLTMVGIVVMTTFGIQAQRSERFLERQIYQSNLISACAAIEGSDVSRAEELLRAAPEALRGWEWAHLWARLDDSLLRLPGDPGASDRGASPIQVSSDGRSAASIGGGGTVQIWDLETHRIRREITLEGTVWILRFTPDGTGLLILQWAEDVGERNVWLELWPLADAEGQSTRYEVWEDVDLADPPTADLDARSLRILFAFRHELVMYDVLAGKATARLTLENPTAWFGSKGRSVLATRGADPASPTVAVLDSSTLGLLGALPEARGPIAEFAQSFDGGTVVCLGANGAAFVWSASEEGLRFVRSLGPLAPGSSVRVSPDGSMLANYGFGDAIDLWSIASGEQLGSLVGHRSQVVALEFIPGSSRVLSTGSSGAIREWDTERVGSRELRGHANYVYPVALTRDGALVATGGWDGFAGDEDALRFWDAVDGSQIAAFGQPDSVLAVRAATFVLDDQSLVVSATRRPTPAEEVLRIDLPSGDVKTLLSLAADSECIAADPTSERIVVCDRSGLLQIVDLRTGRVLEEVSVGSLSWTSYYKAAFSPDGNFLAVSTAGHHLQLWDARTLEVLWDVRAHDGGISQLAFEPRARRLVTVSEDKTVAVWEISTGRRLASFLGHGGGVLCAAFSPDGSRLATGGRDARIRIWSTDDYLEMADLSGHEDYVYSLVWSADGTRLYSGSGDGTVRIWDSQRLAVLAKAQDEWNATVSSARPRVHALLKEGMDRRTVLDRFGEGSEERRAARQILLGASLGLGGGPR